MNSYFEQCSKHVSNNVARARIIFYKSKPRSWEGKRIICLRTLRSRLKCGIFTPLLRESSGFHWSSRIPNAQRHQNAWSQGLFHQRFKHSRSKQWERMRASNIPREIFEASRLLQSLLFNAPPTAVITMPFWEDGGCTVDGSWISDFGSSV